MLANLHFLQGLRQIQGHSTQRIELSATGREVVSTYPSDKVSALFSPLLAVQGGRHGVLF